MIRGLARLPADAPLFATRSPALRQITTPAENSLVHLIRNKSPADMTIGIVLVAWENF
jgi:hypothetical protein